MPCDINIHDPKHYKPVVEEKVVEKKKPTKKKND